MSISMNESTQRRINVSAGTIELLAPAKINLFLYVTGRRPDGYHELAMAMQRVDLCDRIHIRMIEGAEVKVFHHPDYLIVSCFRYINSVTNAIF